VAWGIAVLRMLACTEIADVTGALPIETQLSIRMPPPRRIVAGWDKAQPSAIYRQLFGPLE